MLTGSKRKVTLCDTKRYVTPAPCSTWLRGFDGGISYPAGQGNTVRLVYAKVYSEERLANEVVTPGSPTKGHSSCYYAYMQFHARTRSLLDQLA